MTDGNEAVPLLDASPKPNAQRRSGARAMVAARAVTQRARNALRRRLADRKAPTARQPAELWSLAPPSVADLAAYTRSGHWVPGERAPVLEAIGKAYGYLVAIPVSAALYALAWVLQRPARLLLAVLLLFVLWLAA